MAISWRDSADAFAELLRRHGVDPGAVTDVEAAWRAFGEFVQVTIDGLDTDPDADGFLVQWGRYSWNDDRLSLSFTRQLAVDDPDQQPEYWQVDLAMCFDDEPDLLGLDALEAQDTGHSFDPVGPQRAAALVEMRADLERHPQLRSAWRATPVTSDLSLERQ